MVKRISELEYKMVEITSVEQNKVKRMKRQRNTAQMKEQIRNAEVQINKEEIDKLPEK